MDTMAGPNHVHLFMCVSPFYAKPNIHVFHTKSCIAYVCFCVCSTPSRFHHKGISGVLQRNGCLLLWFDAVYKYTNCTFMYLMIFVFIFPVLTWHGGMCSIWSPWQPRSPTPKSQDGVSTEQGTTSTTDISYTHGVNTPHTSCIPHILHCSQCWD